MLSSQPRRMYDAEYSESLASSNLAMCGEDRQAIAILENSAHLIDNTTRFSETSLNDKLLQGPDMTNNLTGVLLRFRQEPVPFTAIVEQMFHYIYLIDQARGPYWENIGPRS